jgi:hypothetical protein
MEKTAEDPYRSRDSTGASSNLSSHSVLLAGEADASFNGRASRSSRASVSSSEGREQVGFERRYLASTDSTHLSKQDAASRFASSFEDVHQRASGPIDIAHAAWEGSRDELTRQRNGDLYSSSALDARQRGPASERWAEQ